MNYTFQSLAELLSVWTTELIITELHIVTDERSEQKEEHSQS